MTTEPISQPLHLVQLTDTHVVAADQAERAGFDRDHRCDPNRRLRLAVAAINAESPEVEAVLVTGDLAADGFPGEYEMLAELLEPLAAPILAIPGNHDDRGRLRSVFPDLPWADAEHASWTIQHDDVTVIGLDTTIPGEPGAEIDDERAEWLDRALADAAGTPGPTLLAMHHPPFRSGIGWMDRSGFVGLERFVEIIDGRGIDRILCGHLHRPMNAVVGGTIAQVGLSTVQHVAINFDPSDTSDLLLVNDPVGYLIYRRTENSWIAHTRYIDTTERPFHPDWA